MSASRSEFVPVRGLRYHLRRWGDPAGRPLVLLHGWLDCAETFAPMIEALPARWQVIAPDLRGFGDSEWPQDGYYFWDYVGDLDAIVRHYCLDQPFVLVGHSMGAQVASLYAGVRSECVSHLVCLDGLMLPDIPPQRVTSRARQWLEELREEPFDRVYESWSELASAVRRMHPRIDAERARFVAHCWAREARDGSIRLRSDPRHRRLSPVPYRVEESIAVWREVRAATLFVDGALSPLRKLIGEDEIARRRSAFRDHHVASIAGAGHMLHLDAPAETAAAIAAFLPG
jgi:pimeloyl-ACP methyl ester carboxylesterase